MTYPDIHALLAAKPELAKVREFEVLKDETIHDLPPFSSGRSLRIMDASDAAILEVANAAGTCPSAEEVAREFHVAYEKLAPSLGYETRPESKMPFDMLPTSNRDLMVATAAEVLRHLFNRRNQP